jgi:Spy/CpxP family protein refolding chaperone
MTRHLTTMLAAAVLLVATAGFAQGPGFGPGQGKGYGAWDGPEGPEMGMGRGGGQGMINYLGLTDSQVTAWQGLREQLHMTLQPIREQRMALQEQIHTALTSGTPDACAVGQLMVQVHALGDQARAAREANQASFVALLTPDQKVKYQQFLDVRAALGGGPGARGARMHAGRARGPRPTS